MKWCRQGRDDGGVGVVGGVCLRFGAVSKKIEGTVLCFSTSLPSQLKMCLDIKQSTWKSC